MKAKKSVQNILFHENFCSQTRSDQLLPGVVPIPSKILVFKEFCINKIRRNIINIK